MFNLAQSTIGGFELGERTLVTLVSVSGGLTLVLISILVNAVRDVTRAKHHEASRREIAAYVAEGTISPEDAAKLLQAGTKKKQWGCC